MDSQSHNDKFTEHSLLCQHKALWVVSLAVSIRKLMLKHPKLPYGAVYTSREFEMILSHDNNYYPSENHNSVLFTSPSQHCISSRNYLLQPVAARKV